MWRCVDGYGMVSEQMTIGWLAKNSMDRHRPAFLAAEVALLVIGVWFWIDASHQSFAFNAAVFGEFAYHYPAKMWAGLMIALSAITINGLRRPITNWMVAFGAIAQCLHFVLLSYSAVFTGGAFVIGLFASVFFLPLHLWIFFEAAIRDRRYS